jgi:hypothetical protein
MHALGVMFLIGIAWSTFMAASPSALPAEMR